MNEYRPSFRASFNYFIGSAVRGAVSTAISYAVLMVIQRWLFDVPLLSTSMVIVGVLVALLGGVVLGSLHWIVTRKTTPDPFVVHTGGVRFVLAGHEYDLAWSEIRELRVSLVEKWELLDTIGRRFVLWPFGFPPEERVAMIAQMKDLGRGRIVGTA